MVEDTEFRLTRSLDALISRAIIVDVPSMWPANCRCMLCGAVTLTDDRFALKHGQGCPVPEAIATITDIGERIGRQPYTVASDQDREIAELRHALAVGGLWAIAVCPSCSADRTNGERHAEDCPIMRAQHELITGHKNPPG